MTVYRSPLVRVATKGYLGWKLDTRYIRKLVRETAGNIQRDSTSLLEGSTGAGRLWYRPGGGQYRASAPGALPARRTGHLAQSILARVSKRDGLKAWIGPSRGSYKKGEFYPEFLISGRDQIERRLSATSVAGRKHLARFSRELKKAMEKGIKPEAAK